MKKLTTLIALAAAVALASPGAMAKGTGMKARPKISRHVKSGRKVGATKAKRAQRSNKTAKHVMPAQPAI